MEDNKRKYRIKELIFIGVFILVYLPFSVWRNSHASIESDMANLVLEGRDLLNGDFFRRDWNLTGVSFLTTNLPYYVVGVLLFGVSNRANVMAGALMNTFLVATSILLVRNKFKNNRLLSGLMMLTFGMLPGIFAVRAIRCHTGVVVLGFIALKLFVHFNGKMSESGRKEYFLVGLYSLLIAIAYMGDPIILIILVMPIVLWSITEWLKGKSRPSILVFSLAVNMAGAGLGVIFDKLYFAIGGSNKNDFLGGRCFASYDEIRDKLVLYFRGLLLLTDASYENQPVMGIRTLFYAVSLLSVVVFFVLVIYNIICFIRDKKHDYITLILGTGFLLMSVIYIGTSISVDVTTTRYYAYFPVLMAIVFVRNIELIGRSKRIYSVIILSAVILIGGKFYNLKTEVKEIPADQIALGKFLEENGLECGYASFWNASSTTVLSNERVRVRAVIASDEQLSMYRWFCKNEWYHESADFVVTVDDDSFGVTKENIVSVLGEPGKILECGAYNILVYDEDISSRVK